MRAPSRLTPRARLSNEIGALGGEAFAALLIRGVPLRRINLAANRIHDDGARAFAAALRFNPGLEEWVLPAAIGGCAAHAVAVSYVAACARPRRLDLRNNGIEDDGLCALAQGMEANSNLRMLLLWVRRAAPLRTRVPLAAR